MKNRICKVAFHVYGKILLDSFANGVSNGIYSNPLVFIAPPISEADFNAIIADYNAALAD